MPSWVITPPKTDTKIQSDLEWMQFLFADLDKLGRQPDESEWKRINSIYRNKIGAERAYAGSILISYLSVEDYENILRELLFSSNKDELTTAVEMLNFKLSSGTRSEKEHLLDQGDFKNRLKEIKNLEIFENYRLRQIERLVERFEGELSPATQSIANKSMTSTPTFNQSSLSKAVVNEPAEVTTDDVVEEALEQSSQRWLWLVGALVVFGGLGLLLRRKS